MAAGSRIWPEPNGSTGPRHVRCLRPPRQKAPGAPPPAGRGDVMRRATRAGLHAGATGIEHCTVPVVAAHVPFEVTTLRKDIETFGRHARVTFTTDWTED